MKQTPLRRNTPLRPSQTNFRSRWNPALRKAKKDVRSRSNGRCEARTPVCTGRGEHVHHIQLRSQGGLDVIGNLIDVCLACHVHIHDHPAWSYERGLLRKRTA